MVQNLPDTHATNLPLDVMLLAFNIGGSLSDRQLVRRCNVTTDR